MAGFIGKGQALGVIRTDLPADLLVALVMAIDDVYDQWLVKEQQTKDKLEIETHVQHLVNLWRRLLAPPKN